MARRFLVLSTSRGDARGMSVVAAALGADPRAEVRALLTEASANAWQGLLSAGPVATDTVAVGLNPRAGPAELAEAGRRLGGAFQDVLDGWVPDLVVLMGDRHELLPVAHAALLHHLPIAHLSGGDVTEGAFDDSIRHALTKLAHIHFCATEDSARRLRQLGEEPWRIIVSGDPALDRLHSESTAMTPGQLSDRLGFQLASPLALLTYHPPTADRERWRGELAAILEGADEFATVIATHPSAEPGASEIIDVLGSWAGGRNGAHVVTQLGELYAPALSIADAVIGNSSSGVVEAATFGTPAIDVGDRQRGRLRPGNVVHVNGDDNEMREAVAKVLDPAFRQSLAGLVNPYGDGRSGARIASALLDLPLDRLWRKRFVDLD